MFHSLATSTPAERAFSRGGLTVSRLRHSLNDASVRASALLASWSSIPDLIPQADTISLLKSHIRKNRGGRDDGDRPSDRPAENASHAPSAGSTSSRAGNKPSRPSTPSGAAPRGSGKTNKVALAVPGPSVVKPKAVSRSSSAASITSDRRTKDQTRTLLAASGSKTKARRTAAAGSEAATRPDDDLEVVTISSDSE